MKEKHTHKEKRAETVQARKQRFSKTPATTISRRKQRKKNQSTQQKFKPRILVFFFKNHRKERQTETDRDRQRQRQRQRQRAAKTATRTMRSPREKQRQEKPSSSSSFSSSSFSFLNPLFWGDWKMMSLANLEREKWAQPEWRRWNEFPNSQQAVWKKGKKMLECLGCCCCSNPRKCDDGGVTEEEEEERDEGCSGRRGVHGERVHGSLLVLPLITHVLA